MRAGNLHSFFVSFLTERRTRLWTYSYNIISIKLIQYLNHVIISLGTAAAVFVSTILLRKEDTSYECKCVDSNISVTGNYLYKHKKRPLRPGKL